MQGWDHPVSLKQVHWTPWVLFPPWFPALIPIVCLFLSWLSSSPLWETEANSGSIVPHFCFLFYAAEELLLFCFKRCEIKLSFPLAVLRLVPFLSFCISAAFPISVQIYSLSYGSPSNLVWNGNLSSRILPCLGYGFLIQFLICLSWPYFLHLHVQDSALKPGPPNCWRMWDAAAADGGVCFSSAEYPGCSDGVASCRMKDRGP